LIFVKDLHASEEEKENKIQRFSKNVLLFGLFSSEPGQLEQIYVNKS
jgi:hypothetical protein